MNLITPSEWQEFNSAIHDVGDTFFLHPVTYIKVGLSLDRFQETRDDGTPFELLCMVEYPGTGSIEKVFGIADLTNVMLTFNYEYLSEQNMIAVDKRPVFKIGRDLFTVNGENYSVEDLRLDGDYPLESRWELVYVKLKKIIRNGSTTKH